jgi:hypothetical protein
MTRRSGARNWPPHWTTLEQEKSAWPIGEIGTLKRIWVDERMDKCLFLFIEHNGLAYTGMMYFDDRTFCRDIYIILRSKIGWSLKDIGELDLTHTL